MAQSVVSAELRQKVQDALLKSAIDYYEAELLNPVHDITTKAETFVDACYEMILKLHEQKLL